MSNDCLKDIDVVVLAGGLGTRLASVLSDRPKLLAPVGDTPYLEFLLGWLRRFGANRIILSLGHLADRVIEYLDAHPVSGMAIEPVVETSPLGTAGGIANVVSRLRSDPILVMNGDSFVDADLCTFVDSHRRSGAEGSLLCTEVADTSRYGTVEWDKQGFLTRFLEKDPQRAGAGTINAGIYLLGAPVLARISALGSGSVEKDVFEKMEPGLLHTYSGKFRFLDIGTPEDLERAPSVLGALGEA
ncbi:MAG: nucleotidyltransferase family protein [Proteobacteria bacterium]|nr:nucleotidyltransferase family protein [Pseudomonadota bacterium]